MLKKCNSINRNHFCRGKIWVSVSACFSKHCSFGKSSAHIQGKATHKNDFILVKECQIKSCQLSITFLRHIMTKQV